MDLLDRRNYLVKQLGIEIELTQDKDGNLTVTPGQEYEPGKEITKEYLNDLPEQDVQGFLFSTRVKSYIDMVQSHLDNLAQSWGYDNIVSLCSYAGNSHPKYSTEGAAGLSWRSAVWDYCEKELSKISTGTIPEPESTDDFIAGLPKITRPVV